MNVALGLGHGMEGLAVHCGEDLDGLTSHEGDADPLHKDELVASDSLGIRMVSRRGST